MEQSELPIRQVIQGDCLEVMRSFPDKSIDMILSDLPYGITQNKWDNRIPLDLLWSQYNRIIKEDSIIALTASQPFTSILVMSNLLSFKHEWIWIKNRGSNFVNTVRAPMKEHESILIFSNSKKWTYNKQMQERTGGGKDRVKYDFTHETKTTNYRIFGKPNQNQGELRVPSSCQKFNTEVGLHPTQKPLVLFEYLIKTYTNENNIVLDNCLGSGTTACACEKLKRRWIGIEINPEYCEIARKRLEPWMNQTRLTPLGVEG